MAEDFYKVRDEMVKLKKQRRREQRRSRARDETPRHSHSEEAKAVTLTPAEIRAANNAPPSRPRSHHRRHSSSHTRHARTLERPSTPPSPSRGRYSIAYETQAKRSSTLPTPPRSPVLYYSKIVNTQPHPTNFSVPRTQPTSQPFPRVSSPTSIRSTSSNASIRQVPQYRGHDMTRNGSFTYSQRPSVEIVGNPLSQFSRPRRSGSQPPAVSRSSSMNAHVCDHEPSERPRSQSSDRIKAGAATRNTQSIDILRSVSPASFEADQSVRNFKVGPSPTAAFAPSVSSGEVEQAQVSTARPVSMIKASPAKKRFSFSMFRRHTMQVAPDVPTHTSQRQNAQNSAPQPPQATEMPPRPMSEAVIDTGLKGKERESVPEIRCCAKCGRFKKPYSAAEFGMTPLLEDSAGLPSQRFSDMRGAAGSLPTPATQQQLPGQFGSPTTPMRSPRRSKHSSGVSWPDKREDGRIRPPSAPRGLTRFASMHGFTTEGEAPESPEQEEYVSIHERSGYVTPPEQPLEEDLNFQQTLEMIAQQNPHTDSPHQSPAMTPDEPDWVAFYGARQSEELNPLASEETIKGLPMPLEATEATISERQSRDAEPTKPNPSQAWSSLHTALPPGRHPNAKARSPTRSTHTEKEKSVRALSTSGSERDGRRPNKLAKPAPRAKSARNSMTLRELVSMKRSSEPSLPHLLNNDSNVAVIDDEENVKVPAIPAWTTGARTGGQGKVVSMFNGTAVDGNIAKGLAESARIDSMRWKHAERAAEIMAV